MNIPGLLGVRPFTYEIDFSTFPNSTVNKSHVKEQHSDSEFRLEQESELLSGSQVYRVIWEDLCHMKWTHLE